MVRSASPYQGVALGRHILQKYPADFPPTICSQCLKGIFHPNSRPYWWQRYLPVPRRRIPIRRRGLSRVFQKPLALSFRICHWCVKLILDPKQHWYWWYWGWMKRSCCFGMWLCRGKMKSKSRGRSLLKQFKCFRILAPIFEKLFRVCRNCIKCLWCNDNKLFLCRRS